MNNMDKWCLKWNEFDTSIREYLRIIREDQRLFDVTLVTDDGHHMQAHKIILSAGSQFFSDIFLKCNKIDMLIYLKGINSVQLEYFLDFIYNGEASVGQEELPEFLETGEELQVKGFEGYVAGAVETVHEDSEEDINGKEDDNEKRENITDDIKFCETLKPSSKHHYSSASGLIEINEGKIQINANIDLDIQILEMIEKSDGAWKCKVCGKTNTHKRVMRGHAETHIEGMAHACHICNKSFPYRPNLRKHIANIHTKQGCL